MTAAEQLAETLIVIAVALSPNQTTRVVNPINHTLYEATVKEQSSVSWGSSQFVVNVRCTSPTHSRQFGFIHRRSIFKPLKPVESWFYREKRKPHKEPHE